MVSSDDKTCEDAKDYAPHAKLMAVKECVSRYAAICTPPQRTTVALTEAAWRGMERAGRGKPVRGAHRIEVEFDVSHLAQAITDGAVQGKYG